MNITVDDYEVIYQYSGHDGSWRERVSSTAGVERHLSFARVISNMAIVSARYESRLPSKGDNHG
jgi:hypothetical protein